MANYERRNLSGIFIFETFPGEKKRQPTCIEDCTQKTRHQWCEKQDRKRLQATIRKLYETLLEVWVFLYKDNSVEVTKDTMNGMLGTLVVAASASTLQRGSKDLMICVIDVLCKDIVRNADTFGVRRHHTDE